MGEVKSSTGDKAPREPWYSKFLWVVVGVAIASLGSYLIGVAQDKKGMLYYAIQPRVVHSSATGDYVFGTIELGNDGNKDIESWTAEISFPQGTTIRSFATPTLVQPTTSSSALANTRIIKSDFINPGDKILVQYLLDKDSPPMVNFKGHGSTASERQPQQPKDNWACNSLCLILILALAGFLGLFLGVIQNHRQELAIATGKMTREEALIKAIIPDPQNAALVTSLILQQARTNAPTVSGQGLQLPKPE